MNWYLFTAYALVWTLLFAFLVFLSRRQKRLARQIADLARRAEENRRGPADS